MEKLLIDFSKTDGKVKPMHSVNNGPAGGVRGISNRKEYQEAGIPYARIHDASFSSYYGGEHTVDVHSIFPDFDADENDPKSYDFIVTDKYLNEICAVGTKVFYRLGSKIEHGIKKYGTFPPKDFHKWARICEHIIRHYTEGWADGFFMDIEYWEIWNEPECRNDDGTNPCWQGSNEEFAEFFSIAQKHLKKCFPNLKIGGPAFCSPNSKDAVDIFDQIMSRLIKDNVPLDFFSFHIYPNNPIKILNTIDNAVKLLEKYGYNNTELILNEWNYVKGWRGDEWFYTLQAEKGLKGASFIAATMGICQYTPLDHLMYYDARPCSMNGMFDTDLLTPLKGYYPFKMFNELYKLGTAVKVKSDCDSIYACAANGNDASAVMVTYFNDDDNLPVRETKIEFKNPENKNGVKLEYYLLDENHDCELVREETVMGNDFSSVLNMTLFSTYLIKIIKL